MDYLALLQKLTSFSGGASAQAAKNDGIFPPDRLRFVLEYPSTPDLDAERGRLSTLLGHDVFSVVKLSELPQLAPFLVLQFSQCERTLPRRDLFSIGYGLADTLGLVSATPDAGDDFFVDPEPMADEPSAEATNPLDYFCQVRGEGPVERKWALRKIGISEDWNSGAGEGILIGQPDTGIAKHDELDDCIFALDLARNFLEANASPADPLAPGTANPGHGTATASVAASRDGGRIRGVATKARIVPIRCIEDVKVFDTSPVAAAIAHAVGAGCHVVSMSLGGAYSRSLHAAVKAAVEAGLIVIAAAGNCVRTVVWPARFREVIAVAGTNIVDEPWRGTCSGSSVDISAPAEFVWRAFRTKQSDPLSGISAGQGTSFATALTAGAAAVWLGHHGVETVRQEARKRSIAVQELFRAAMCRSARIPEGWNTTEMGAGILDVPALLSLPLEAIAEADATPDVYGGPEVERFVGDELGDSPRDADFDWPRYSAEITSIGLSHARAGAPIDNLSSESKLLQTYPSAQLAAAAERTTDERIRRFGISRQDSNIFLSVASAQSRKTLSRLALALPADLGLEAASGVFNATAARSYLKGQGLNEQLDRVEKALCAEPLADPETKEEVVRCVEAALSDIASNSPLSTTGALGLEALVRLTGRPALRVRDNCIDLDSLEATEWHDRLYLLMSDDRLQQRMQATGRIDLDGKHVGTGFVVGHGLVLTNRHVVEAFAAPVPCRDNPGDWLLLSDSITIDFADEPSSNTAASRFRIKSVLSAGSHQISGRPMSFANVDAAIVEVETTNEAGSKLPDPVELLRDPTKADSKRQICLVSYPGRPAALPRDNFSRVRIDVVRRLTEIFGADYGTKYLSPGEIVLAAGEWADNSSGWTFTHDATTLNGSSGSLAVIFNEPVGAIGLHFGGGWMRENYAHSLSALFAKGTLLASTALDWK